MTHRDHRARNGSSALRQLAASDVEGASEYHRREAGEQTALDYIDAVESAVKRIRRGPQVGSLRFAYELAIQRRNSGCHHRAPQGPERSGVRADRAHADDTVPVAGIGCHLAADRGIVDVAGLVGIRCPERFATAGSFSATSCRWKCPTSPRSRDDLASRSESFDHLEHDIGALVA